MSDAEVPAVRAIVAGHGDWAAGLVSAVSQITGRGALFLPLSNSGASGQQLEASLRSALDCSAARIVFTDLLGGSWTLAVRRVQRDRPSLVLVTGTNLPMLLDFAFHDASPADDAARVAVEKGRSAMTVAGGPPGGGKRAD
ncbi:MAG: PTS sugar transporter subunit IIA [Gemmatimonadaceae bacterium]